MNKHQLAQAYADLKAAYELKAHQRDALDRSDDYLQIMQLVHEVKWAEADVLMQKNNYFKDRMADDDPKFELVGD